MLKTEIKAGMTEYDAPLNLSDDSTREVVISEIKKLQPGESQSYPVQTPITQGDFGKIGYHVNVDRLDGRKSGITIELVEGENGTILFATCPLENDLR